MSFARHYDLKKSGAVSCYFFYSCRSSTSWVVESSRPAGGCWIYRALTQLM